MFLKENPDRKKKKKKKRSGKQYKRSGKQCERSGLTLNGRNAINDTIVVESVHKILDKNMVLMHKILDLKHVKNC